MKTYYVYIMTNKSRTLYTGTTSDLVRRVWQHKQGEGSAFTARYKIKSLVYYEGFATAEDAIGWEKRIKGWLRAKKVALIEAANPEWLDLSEGWYD